MLNSAAPRANKEYLAYSKIARNSTDISAPLHFADAPPTWVMPTARAGFRETVVSPCWAGHSKRGGNIRDGSFGENLGSDSSSSTRKASSLTYSAVPCLMGGAFICRTKSISQRTAGRLMARDTAPEIRVSFFSQAELQNGRDAALQEAIRHIKIKELRLRKCDRGFPKRTPYGNSGNPIAVDHSLCAHWFLMANFSTCGENRGTSRLCPVSPCVPRFATVPSP
jgi:hypothetical protein